MRTKAPHPHVEEPPKSDAELMGSIASGNLTALGALYDRYYDDVLSFVDQATGRSADTDDLVHDLFLNLIEVAAVYDGRPSARPFLIGMAAQRVRRRAQRFGRIFRLLSRFRDSIPCREQQTPEDLASDREEIDIVSDVLANLSEEKRLVLLMVEREGLSGEEVAEALGIPIATVWTRLHYGRAELRSALAKRRTR